MPKVYCVDCKFYMPPKGGKVKTVPSCEILFNEWKETTIGPMKIHKNCEEANKNNKCEYYEEKLNDRNLE